jgi:hypothetical protein
MTGNTLKVGVQSFGRFLSGMTSPYNRYPAADQALPEKTWAWNVYGAGEENIGRDDYQALVDELTGGNGFDDIVMLDPRSAATVGAVATHTARRGTLNLLGQTALDGLVDADVGRLHYDYTAYIGGKEPDIATILDPGDMWTAEAEAALFEKYWRG